jgi:transcriptional regulator with XRE-family HTH domain
LDAKTLAELRGDMTQRDLAKALNLKPSTIAMYEIGERTPPLETAKRIAGFFGVSVESIKFGKDARISRSQKPTGTDGQ